MILRLHALLLLLATVLGFASLILGNPIGAATTKQPYPALQPVDSTLQTDPFGNATTLRPLGGKQRPPLCNVQNFRKGWVVEAQQAIKNLERKTEKGETCYIGPRQCQYIACDEDTLIQLCNDRHDAISPTCSYLGSYAQDIIAQCKDTFWDSFAMVQGQMFDTDGYNIIVRADKKQGCPFE